MEDSVDEAKPHWKVQHNYHDYSQARDSERGGLPGSNGGGGKQEGRSQDSKFPILLHYILGELEKEGKSHVMGWMAHGRAFIVRDQKRLEEEILPNWFRQKKFHSFQRQLNIYGFLRLTSGPDKGSYYHEMFLRGKRFLSERILRIKIKGEGPRKPNSPETEPNLYLYPAMGPSDEPEGVPTESSATAPSREGTIASSFSNHRTIPMSSGMAAAPGTNDNRLDMSFLTAQQYCNPAFMNGFAAADHAIPFNALLSMQNAALFGLPSGSHLSSVSFMLPPPATTILDSDREKLRLMLQQQPQGRSKDFSAANASPFPAHHGVTGFDSASVGVHRESATGNKDSAEDGQDWSQRFPSLK